MALTKDAQKLRRAAERKGKAEDQSQLALLLYYGSEVLKQDKVAAAKWWRKAAAQEHAIAQHALGGCYKDGEGVEQNDALALTWWEKAAGHGFAKAQSCLGCLYASRRWRGAGRRSGGGVVGESRGGGRSQRPLHWATYTACSASPRTRTAPRSS